MPMRILLVGIIVAAAPTLSTQFAFALTCGNRIPAGISGVGAL